MANTKAINKITPMIAPAIAPAEMAGPSVAVVDLVVTAESVVAEPPLVPVVSVVSGESVEGCPRR